VSVRGDILENLEGALNAIKENSAYPMSIATVSRFDINKTSVSRETYPVVIIYDGGPEVPVVEDDTHFHYLMSLSFIAAVQSTTLKDLEIDLNNLIATIKQFLASTPALGDNVMRLRCTGIESNIYETKEAIVGSTLITATLRYWCNAGSF
jgi:hypothetical protein